MWGGESWSSSEGDEDEDYEGEQAPPDTSRLMHTDELGRARPVNYEHQYNDLEEDVLGEDDNEDDEDDDPWGYDSGKKKKNRPDAGESEQEPSYMLFDFRHGREKWPQGVELVDNELAAELLEKAKKEAEAEAKRQQEREAQKDKDKDKDKEKDKEKSSDRKKGFSSWGGGMSGAAYGPVGFGGGTDFDPWSSFRPGGEGGSAAVEDIAEKEWKAPEDAVFETLNDGSTAFVLPPGKRLKIDLSALLDGGDAKKEEREKKKRRRRKRMGKWGGWYGGGDWKSSWKEWVNEYTITMDIKVMDSLPREGLSLFQTALVHAGAAQKSGRGKLKQTDGEAIISSAGGVGILGSFGDVTKAKVKLNRWHRVAVSVKCAADTKQKGELLTWVDAAGGAVVKSEAIAANGRFALDPASLFLFSSAQSAMMSRTVAIRTVRVVARPSDDAAAKADLARDRLVSMFNVEREREIDAQRRGLSLASLFAKPRPVRFSVLVPQLSGPNLKFTFAGVVCASPHWNLWRPFHRGNGIRGLVMSSLVVSSHKSGLSAYARRSTVALCIRGGRAYKGSFGRRCSYF